MLDFQFREKYAKYYTSLWLRKKEGSKCIKILRFDVEPLGIQQERKRLRRWHIYWPFLLLLGGTFVQYLYWKWVCGCMRERGPVYKCVCVCIYVVHFLGKSQYEISEKCMLKVSPTYKIYSSIFLQLKVSTLKRLKYCTEVIRKNKRTIHSF